MHSFARSIRLPQSPIPAVRSGIPTSRVQTPQKRRYITSTQSLRPTTVVAGSTNRQPKPTTHPNPRLGNPSMKSNTASDPIDLTSDPDPDPDPDGVSLPTPVNVSSRNSKSESKPIDAEDEDEDEDADLRRAIALSLLPANNDGPAQVENPEPLKNAKSLVASHTAQQYGKPTPPSTHQRQPQQTTNFLNGLPNRAQMERERLARLKRKRGEVEISPPPLARRVKSPDQEGKGPWKANSTVSAQIPSAISSPPTRSSALKYTAPTVLKTYSAAHPSTPSDPTISLPDVLNAQALQSCLLSSFIWDFDWLFPHFSTTRTKFLLVMHAKYPHQRAEITSDFSGIPNVRLCFPAMEGSINCMHSKLMLLFFERYMRIVVPTANLVPFDWGEDGGVMENCVFVVDLPLLKPSTSQPSSSATQSNTTKQNAFHNSLAHFLSAQTIPLDVLAKLDTFDFTPCNNIRFVHSIGGLHAGSSFQLTGHPGLGHAVTSLGLRTTQTIHADFVTSSVGSLTAEFLRAIYLAAQGDVGHAELALRTEKKFPRMCEGSIYATLNNDTGNGWRENFRFYFPSEATIKASRGGPRKAGTICFQERWWNGAKFPRDNMRDCVSTRQGLMMHHKILYIRFPKPIKGDAGDEFGGWAYIGSANLSESAWGHLGKDRQTKAPKLHCKNWECGVIIPVNRPDNALSSGDGLDCFRGKVPVPMQYPGTRFESRRPWFFQGGDA